MTEKVIIGNAELWHGDCREVLPLLAVHDLLLTDPPYGLEHVLKGGTWGKQYEAEEYSWDKEPPNIDAALAKAKTQIVWGGNYFGLPPTRCFLVFDKTIRGMTFADCEMAWSNLDANARVFSYQVPRGFLAGERFHPTQKPVPVMAWCIQFAPDAQTVLDPFMGSGTTGVACVQLGRTFTGIERERKYFDIACERIARAQAQGRMFPDEKLGAGNTAIQAELLPVDAKHP